MNHMVIGYDDADRDPGYETTQCPDCEGAGNICEDCKKPLNYYYCDTCEGERVRCERCDAKGTIYIDS